MANGHARRDPILEYLGVSEEELGVGVGGPSTAPESPTIATAFGEAEEGGRLTPSGDIYPDRPSTFGPDELPDLELEEYRRRVQRLQQHTPEGTVGDAFVPEADVDEVTEDRHRRLLKAESAFGSIGPGAQPQAAPGEDPTAFGADLSARPATIRPQEGPTSPIDEFIGLDPSELGPVSRPSRFREAVQEPSAPEGRVGTPSEPPSALQAAQEAGAARETTDIETGAERAGIVTEQAPETGILGQALQALPEGGQMANVMAGSIVESVGRAGETVAGGIGDLLGSGEADRAFWRNVTEAGRDLRRGASEEFARLAQQDEPDGFLEFAARETVRNLPIMGIGIASGGLGAAATGATGFSAAMAGAFGPFYFVEKGFLQGELEEHGVDEDTAEAWAAAGAIPMALAESAFESTVAGRALGPGRIVSDRLRSLFASRLGAMAKGMGRGALIEGTTEPIQEILGLTTRTLATGEMPEAEEVIDRLGQAVKAGATVGGVIGGPAGFVEPIATVPETSEQRQQLAEAGRRAAEREQQLLEEVDEEEVTVDEPTETADEAPDNVDARLEELGRQKAEARRQGDTEAELRVTEEINELLEVEAETDPLTGLVNRRGERRAQERRTQPEGTERVALQGDLDNFKAINEVMGEKEGDRALQLISETLVDATREEDVVSVARHGGDEFRVTLDLDQAADPDAVAARIEAAVNDAMEEAGYAEAGGVPVGFSFAQDVKARKAERGVTLGREEVERRVAEQGAGLAPEGDLAERARTMSEEEFVESLSAQERANLDPDLGFVRDQREVGEGVYVENQVVFGDREVDPNARAVVFRDDEGVARGALTFNVDPETGDATQPLEVFVEPDFRRQGVATSLFERAEEEGFNVRAIRGEGGLTEDGARLFHRQANRPTTVADREFRDIPVRSEEVAEPEPEPGPAPPAEPAAIPQDQAVQKELSKQPPTRVDPQPDVDTERPAFGERGEEPARNVFSLRPSAIVVDPGRMQFKFIGKAARGEALAEAETFDDIKAGTLLVWWDPNETNPETGETGAWVLADGHQRMTLARDQGVDRVNVQEIEAATAEDARATAALRNIAEGTGTAIDAAKFFRDGDMTRDDLRANGLVLTDGLAERALALANLPEAIFRRVATGKMKQRRAAIIGRSDLSEGQMLQLFERIADRDLTNAELTEMVDEIESAPTRERVEQTLFGEETFEESLVAEKAKIRSHIRSQLREEARTFNFLTRRGRAQRLEEAGVAEGVQEDEAARIGTEAQQFEEAFNRLVNRAAVQRILNEEAQNYAEASGRTGRRKIQRQAADRVRSVLEEELQQGAGDRGVQEAGEAGGAAAGEGPAAGRRKDSTLEPDLFTGEQDRPRGGEAGFIDLAGRRTEAEGGHYEVLTEQLAGLKEGAEGFLQRNFTVTGDLPKSAFDAKIRRDGWMNAELQQVKFVLRDLRNAIRQIPGVSRLSVDPFSQLTEPEVDAIDRALRGEVPLEELPQPLREPIHRARQQIDHISIRLIENGAVEGKLAGVVAENLGVYLTRSYKAYDDPKWSEKVPQDVRNKAKALIRSEIKERGLERQFLEGEDISGLSQEALDAELEARAEGLINNLLYEASKSGPIGFLSRSKLGSKDIGILMKRKDIAPEIRALLGEHEDPRVNYARTVNRMVDLLGNHNFLTEVRQEGIGEFLFEEAVVRDGVSYHAEIAGEESAVMSPLNGLHTTEEIAEALENYGDSGVSGPFLRRYMKANGAVKLTKTVLSLMTHVRNFIANPIFLVANGNNPFALKPGGAAFRAHVGPWESLVQRARGETQEDVQAFRDYYLKMQRLGVVDESTRADELRDVVRDATRRGADDFVGDPSRAAIRRGMENAGALYKAEDDFWKLVAFEQEKAKYAEALPDVSEAEIEARAAEIVRNTLPTYSLVPRAVRGLRRFPLVGTFVSFPAEVFRTGYNTLSLTRRELSSTNPKVRNIGARRLAGVLTAAASAPAMAMAARFLTGIDQDQDDNIRRFLPPWSQNSSIIYLGKNDEGEIRWLDVSYTDVYNYFRKPVIAMMRGDDFTEDLYDAAVELLEPFLGEEIMVQKLLDISRNKTRTGGEVYNPADGPLQQNLDKLAHLWEAFEPGTISNLERIKAAIGDEQQVSGQTYDPVNEVIALFGGIRINTLNVPSSLRFRLSDRRDRVRDSERILTSTVARGGRVTADELVDAYNTANRSRKDAWQKAAKDANAALELGMERAKVERTLRNQGFSQRDAAAIMNGVYLPYAPSDQFYRTLGEGAVTGSEGERLEGRIDAIVDRRALIGELLRQTADEQMMDLSEEITPAKRRAIQEGRR